MHQKIGITVNAKYHRHNFLFILNLFNTYTLYYTQIYLWTTADSCTNGLSFINLYINILDGHFRCINNHFAYQYLTCYPLYYISDYCEDVVYISEEARITFNGRVGESI